MPSGRRRTPRQARLERDTACEPWNEILQLEGVRGERQLQGRILPPAARGHLQEVEAAAGRGGRAAVADREALDLQAARVKPQCGVQVAQPDVFNRDIRACQRQRGPRVSEAPVQTQRPLEVAAGAGAIPKVCGLQILEANRQVHRQVGGKTAFGVEKACRAGAPAAVAPCCPGKIR